MSKPAPSKPAPSLSPRPSNLMNFVNRYNDLMAVRDSTDKLIEDTLLYCQGLERALNQETNRLEGELRNCQVDLAESNASRREFEKKLSRYESEMAALYTENKTYQTRNPYIVVLIDGDGLLFQDAWIRQGAEGGKKAASALYSSVARQWTGKNQNMQVIAKVVANCAGLACALNSNDFRDFAAGFTQGNAAFDFVDIGNSKERRADSKIRDNIRWHLQNFNCQQILLGISNDARNANFIEDLFRANVNARDRISLIESGAGLSADLKATGANTTRLDKDIFRVDKLVERTSAYAAATIGPRTASPAGSVASSGGGGGGGGGANSSTFSYANAIINGTPPPTMSIPLAPNKPSPRSKANGASSSSPSPSPGGGGGGGGGGSPQYQKIPPQQPDWNPGARGLDEPIIVNVAVMDAVKKRKDTDKLCNNHFLRGPCAKGEGCNFVHDYKPNSEETNAIAVLARQNPCTHGQDCENWECIYGHHCPSIRDGVCTHPYCKFDEEQHPPGTKFTASKSSNR